MGVRLAAAVHGRPRRRCAADPHPTSPWKGEGKSGIPSLGKTRERSSPRRHPCRVGLHCRGGAVQQHGRRAGEWLAKMMAFRHNGSSHDRWLNLPPYHPNTIFRARGERKRTTGAWAPPAGSERSRYMGDGARLPRLASSSSPPNAGSRARCGTLAMRLPQSDRRRRHHSTAGPRTRPPAAPFCRQRYAITSHSRTEGDPLGTIEIPSEHYWCRSGCGDMPGHDGLPDTYVSSRQT